MTARVIPLPVADNRLAGMIAAPAEALDLIKLAIERTDELARLVREAAPAREINAAAKAVAVLGRALANLKLTADVLDAALRVRESIEHEAAKPAPEPPGRLRALPGSKDGASPEEPR